jgi:excisionase family DNA binding protein
MGRDMKNVSTDNGPRFFTIIDVANVLDVSTRTVRRWIKSKLLVAHRINGLVRISEADFRAFMSAHRDR